MSFKAKYSVSMLKLEVAPLRVTVELGRLENVNFNDRICQWCNSETVEDKRHFLISRILFNHQKQKLYTLVSLSVRHFNLLLKIGFEL